MSEQKPESDRRGRPLTFSYELVEERFVQEYFAARFCATTAMRRISPKMSAKQVRHHACMILKRDSVRKRIKIEAARLKRKNKDVVGNVVAELSKIAFSDMGDYFDFSGNAGNIKLNKPSRISPSARQAIAQLRVSSGDGVSVSSSSIKLYDKVKALDLLCKIHGLYETPDLEILLGRLPPELATILRRELFNALRQTEVVRFDDEEEDGDRLGTEPDGPRIANPIAIEDVSEDGGDP